MCREHQEGLYINEKMRVKNLLKVLDARGCNSILNESEFASKSPWDETEHEVLAAMKTPKGIKPL